MTRRGSLAYYLAAVVLGCFLMTLALWLPRGSHGTHWTPDTRGASGFLFVCFLGFLFGTPAALLFGFLLRKAAGLLRLAAAWHWILAGAVLALAEIWLLGSLTGLPLPWPVGGVAGRVSVLLLLGPAMVRDSSRLWAVAPVGALTALVLHRIHCAFKPKAEHSV